MTCSGSGFLNSLRL